MGATAIVKKPLISNQTFIGIVPQENINSEFLFYLMNTNSDRLQYLGSGAIQQYLSKEDFQSLKLAFPPLSEQHAISSFLDRQTVNLNTFIAKIQEAIEKLQEYRT
ncbi:MAG: restriction endonuclease subunit S, partial [Methanosarcinales archaeon]